MMVRVCIIGLLLAVLLSCGQPTEQVTAPSGTFTCQASERGRLVGTGWFTIQPGGQIEDKITGETGSWIYEAGTKEFLFTGNLDVERATYDSDTDEVIFYLRPEVYRTHVEDGKLVCYRTDG